MKKIFVYCLLMLPMFAQSGDVNFSFEKNLNDKFLYWVCSVGKAVSLDDGNIELVKRSQFYHLTKYPLNNRKTMHLRFHASGKGTVGIFVYDSKGKLTRQITDRLPNSKEMRLFQVEYDLAKELADLDRNSVTVRLFFRSREKLIISDKDMAYEFE